MRMRLLFVKDFLDLIFPRNCELCTRALFDYEFCLCTICEGKLPITSYHLRATDNDLKDKLQGLTRVLRVLAFLKFTKYGKSQRLLHQLKYRNKPQVGYYLGKKYGQLLLKQDYSKSWDCIVPVPLHRMKLKRRGYNQSEEFAKGLAESLGIQMENILERIVATETQTKKSRLERMGNVEEVFQLKSNISVQNRNILLVDDVITTGATLCSSANVLLANGAKNVDLATIAAGGKI